MLQKQTDKQNYPYTLQVFLSNCSSQYHWMSTARIGRSHKRLFLQKLLAFTLSAAPGLDCLCDCPRPTLCHTLQTYAAAGLTYPSPYIAPAMAAQQEQLRQFWLGQMQEIHQVGTDPAEFKNHQLPLARIKKVSCYESQQLAQAIA